MSNAITLSRRTMAEATRPAASPYSRLCHEQSSSVGRADRLRRGFSLIELMISIAILAILAGIAVPAYHAYMREARYSVLRLNIDGMRTFLEDYRLENGNYVDAQWMADGSATTLQTIYEWQPDGDERTTDYTLTAIDGGASYDLFAVDTDDPDVWVRCEDRMGNCCYPDMVGAAPGACPALP